MSEVSKKKGHGEKKSRKQDIAILALLTEKTIGDAAEKAGIAESTLWRWMQEDDFQEEYKQAKRESVSHATARLRASMTVAIDALVELCERGRSEMAKASAARTLLEYGLKAHWDEDVHMRLQRLEESEAQGDS